jgi:hypothetical protein
MKTLLTNKCKNNNMQNKYFSSSGLLSASLLLTCLFLSFSTFAQHEEYKQYIQAFAEAKAGQYEKKSLNVTEPKLGELPNTNHSFHDFFVLRANEKSTDKIGNTKKLKINCSFYAYESSEECDYALSFWFKNFIGGQRLTPGRPVKTYKDAQPTIIIINATEISIVSFDCFSYDPDFYRELKKDMMTFFGNDKSMVIEIKCDGPLEWTKNPPDSKDKKWRM